MSKSRALVLYINSQNLSFMRYLFICFKVLSFHPHPLCILSNSVPSSYMTRCNQHEMFATEARRGPICIQKDRRSEKGIIIK